ncbi:MAG: hypothetical protein J6M30_09395 [Bacteroidales bacterium]|nr:hypothetical protein [Bacteroidales bacterium]MBP3254706.1 hypothetical protein [Bacteroidales bacterium]
MRRLFVIFILFSAVAFTACDVDFDPNEPWSEQMVVYSLIDQDDDTTFVRVEKRFYGRGNAVENAKVKDSLYYKADELRVRMFTYYTWDTNNVIDTFNFAYTTHSAGGNGFYQGDDIPLYYCITKGKLNYNMYCRLEVTNMKTCTVAMSGARLLSDYSVQMGTFASSIQATDKEQNKIRTEWTNTDVQHLALNQVGKQYQVVIRFNYSQNSVLKYVDIPLTKKINSSSSSWRMQADITLGEILSGLKVLEGQSGIKWYASAPFEVRVLACDLSMYDYMSVNNQSQNSLTFTPVYSNIDGGVGLFAARRTHISKKFADKQVDSDLKAMIYAMDIGFTQ